MTEHTPNQSGSLPDGLPLGALLRAAADAELTSEQEAALPAIDRRDERIAFERELRTAVGRTMGGAAGGSGNATPAELRERINAMYGNGGRGDQSQGEATPGVLQTPMGDTRERSFWSRISGVSALAAVLALCATVVIFSLQQNQSNPGASGATTLRASMLGSFIHGEHQHCAGDRDYATKKFRVTDHLGALNVAKEHFGAVPPLLARGFNGVEEAGFRFGGVSACAVPGNGKSIHIVFHSNEEETAEVSLFIQQDARDWKVSDGRCAKVKEGLPDGQTVTVWRSEGFFHFLITTRQGDLETFHTLLEVPTKQCTFTPAR